MGTDKLESHHAAPRCLLTLHERANGTTSLDGEAIQAWVEWELEALVEKSAELLERKRHRLLHESDWQRWGSRGGRETLRRYGNSWMALLALKRWGRITAAELEAARPLR